jgi:segregation and condensation protein B
MTLDELKLILKAALLSTSDVLTIEQLQRALFDEENRPSTALFRQAIEVLQQTDETEPLELVKVAGGYRFQIKPIYSPYIKKLHEKRPPRYSRALLETLALIAYRQPMTRGEVEEVRGVSTSSHIFKTLLERAWVKVIGYKNVPGKPALYGTTKQFLSYFNLKDLSALPPLKEWATDGQLDDKLAQLGLTLDASDRQEPIPVPIPITDPHDNPQYE